MAISVSTIKNLPKMHGGIRGRIVEITFDNSYPTGGEAVSAADVGLDSAIYLLVPETGMFDPGAGGGLFPVRYDHSAGKLQAFYADNDAAADGPLIEYANGGSALEDLTVRCLVFGV